MANKLLQQQLKNIIRSLLDEELETVFNKYEALSGTKFEKSCRAVSYKW